MLTLMGLPNNLIWFMILHAYSASSSVRNSQNPYPWCVIEMRSLGRWTLAGRGRRTSSAVSMRGRKARDGGRTDWTGLEHQFPHQRVRHSLIQVALRASAQREGESSARLPSPAAVEPSCTA